MAYREKAQEFRKSAEFNVQHGMYNSAANRYYYCLFVTAKGLLEQDNFNYKLFMKNSRNIRDKDRHHREYSHATIHIALAEYLRYNVEDFKEKWREIYELRRRADYSSTHISQEEIDMCRDSFYEIMRRIHNE